MAKFTIFLIIFQLAIWTNPQTLAHVCDDVLMHDPIVIWPEKEIVEITKIGQFKIFLRNEYSDSIHNVRVITPPSPFEFSVNPPLIEGVKPREQVSFLINLFIPEKIKPGRYPLLIKVNAQEFAIDREVSLTIKVKEPFIQPKPQPKPEPEPEPQPEPQAVIEIKPGDILVAISAFPAVIETEPGKIIKFKIFVRNGHTISLRNLTLSVSKDYYPPTTLSPEERAPHFEILNIEPKLIEEIKPGDITSFEVTLKIPEKIERGDYPLFVEIRAQELSLARQTSLVVKIKKVKEWISYFYILAILFLIGLLIWRWRKLTRERSRLLPVQ